MNTKAHQHRAQLPDIGDGLAGRFMTLYADPTRPGCEHLVLALQGAIQHVQRLSDALREAETPTV